MYVFMKKAKQTSESIELGILLAISGGLMDAYSYLLRGQVFANAQTGNILLFGVFLSQGKFETSLRYLFPVIAFTLGIAIAESIRFDTQKKVHWRQVSLLFEILILFLVAFIPLKYNMIANSLTSFACGIQVQSFRKIHGNSYATTMCIGNLRSGASWILSYLRSHKTKDLEKGSIYFLIILCFVIGAIFGNQLIPLFGTYSILCSCLLLFISFIVMFIDREKEDCQK